MLNIHTVNRRQHRRSRARLLVAALLLAGVAFVAPAGVASPAGAFGSKSVGCNASGYSGLSGSRAIASTTGSICGSNWVRWHYYWGAGSWAPPVYNNPASIVESPHLYAGGAGHRACDGCTIVST